MRKFLLSFAAMLFMCFAMMAQTPNALKYQAVARNSSGEIMSDKTMSVRISIIKGSLVEYSEVHTVTTNEFGLFTVEVGRGSPESGNFMDIAWSDDTHFMRVEMDPHGGNNYMFLGTSELLSVPYSMHAETVTQNDDADADPTNEIQDLKVVGNELRITGNPNPTEIDLTQFNTDNQQISYDADQHIINLEDGGSVDLSDLKDDGDADATNEIQTVTQVGTVVTLSHGGGSFSVEDGDPSPVNELQTLSQNGNVITLSQNGGSVTITDGDSNPTNEIQDLSFNNNYLFVTNNPNATVIDLNPLMDNTDNQQLAFDPQTANLALQNGGVVNLSSLEDDADADTTNELQTITRVGNDLVLSHNGGTVNIEDDDSSPTNELQTLSQNGNVVTLSNNGGTISIADDDSNPFNEIQDLMLIGDTLIATLNPNATFINLGAVDNQTLNFDNNTHELTIANGNTVDLTSLEDDADADPVNEIQDLFKTGDSLIITNNPSATVIDLSSYMDNTDTQDMSLTGNTLSLTGDVTPVDLTPFMDNTDAQDMTLAGNTLSLTGDITPVDLTPFMDNTDAQDMTLAGNTLSLTGDITPVDLTPFMDNTDAQDMTLAGNTLSLTGDITPVDLTPFMDNTDAQDMTLAGNTLSLTGDATPVNLTPYLDNTDAQDMTLTGNTLSLTGDVTPVDLTSYMDNTDAQDMTLTGNTLSLTGDATTVDLTSYMDNTDAQTLSILGMNLSISGGNTIAIPSSADNLGNHTATQNLAMSGNYISNDGDNEGLKILNNGNVNATGDFFVGDNAASNRDAYFSGRMFDWDNVTYNLDPNVASKLNDLTVETKVTVNGTGKFSGAVDMSSNLINNVATPVAGTDAANKSYVDAASVAQDMSLTGNSLSLTGDATPVDLTPYMDNTDMQMISISNDSLIISGGNQIDLSSYLDNTDAQTLSLAGDSLTISTGNSVDLSALSFMKGSSNLSEVTNAATARTNIGVVIGTDVQAYDDGLVALANLNAPADKMIYSTGADAFATTDITAFGRSFVGSATAASGATTLGLGTGDTPTFNGLSLTASLAVTGDVKVGDADAFYLGDPSTNGSWRVVRSGSDLSFERREGGSWVQKSVMIP